jgi:hypothetical protein
MKNQDIEKIMDLIESANKIANDGKLETFELPQADELDKKEKDISKKFDEILANLDEIYKIIQFKHYLKDDLVNPDKLPDVGSYYKRLDCMGKWKCVDLQIERTPDGQRIAIMSLDNQANVERFDLKKGFWNHFKEYSV